MSESIAEAVAEAQGAIAGGTPTEREARIVVLFDRWDAAKKVQAETKAKVKEALTAATAGMRVIVEQAIPASDTQARLVKLSQVELAWTHLDEVKAEAIEERKHAADVVANAERRLREAVENSKQMTLFETE